MSMLNASEILLVLAYLAATFGLALRFARAKGRARDSGEYFLAGRALPWYLIGFSYYASNMSGASFVGLIGASYAFGVTVFHYEWTAALVLVVLAAFVLPVFLRNRLYTVPEYLERRFETRTRVAYSIFTLLTLLFIDTAGALYAGAVVISTGFPFLELWVACVLISLCAGAYTIFGGLRAVVVTDTLQALVLIVGALLVAVIGLSAVGGWGAMMDRLEPGHTRLFLPPGDDFLPWPGIGGVVVLGLYYWVFNQYFVQRALAARTLDEGRKGALFAGLLKVPNLMLMIVPGLVAAALYPGLASPDEAFPTLAFELLPVGLRGIILAAMLAAIMSSLDSALNAAATLVTMDLVKPLRPGAGERGLIATGRIATGVMMVIAAVYAPLIASFGSLFEYFQLTLAYLVPPVVAVYLGGLLAPRLTRSSGFWALAIVEPAALALFLAQEVAALWVGLHFTYMAMLLLVVTLGIMAAVSTLRPGDAPHPETLAARADLKAERRGLADWRVQAGLLMGLVALALLMLA